MCAEPRGFRGPRISAPATEVRLAPQRVACRSAAVRMTGKLTAPHPLLHSITRVTTACYRHRPGGSRCRTMAPQQKRRTEKAVLSRQEIANRKRELSDKKLETSDAGHRAIAGVFVLAFSLIGLLSVATFAPADRTGPGFRNAI